MVSRSEQRCSTAAAYRQKKTAKSKAAAPFMLTSDD
jgi:hypothetical protein